jgi:hypothetical protein
MIAAAQPTPRFTAIALTGQFIAQAPHSMHRARACIAAFLSGPSSEMTACGQTSMQAPQPTHFASSIARLSPFFR